MELPTSGPLRWERPLPIPKGVSVAYVPDMWFDATGGATITECAGQTTCATAGATNNPGPGKQTYYYTNQQSARLLFYHDHAWGITRLNVYAGEAAGYLITDPVEQALVNGGTVKGQTYTAGTIPATQIPLIIQDKTFVNASIRTMVLTRIHNGHRSYLGLGLRSRTTHNFHANNRRPLVAPCLYACPEPL